jgi:hypothetical protein
MQPAQNKPDFKAQFTQLFDNDVYPNYAHNQETNEKIWNLCMELTHNQGM